MTRGAIAYCTETVATLEHRFGGLSERDAASTTQVISSILDVLARIKAEGR